MRQRCDTAREILSVAGLRRCLAREHRSMPLRLLVMLLFVVIGDAAERRPSVLVIIADDWSWPHAGAYGGGIAPTPHFDRVAREGALFSRTFCASPSCTPSRAALLSGQAIHRLEESGNLWSTLRAAIPVYPDLLAAAGWTVGCQGKGWGPGDIRPGGRTHNPAGPPIKDIDAFIAGLKPDQPFCAWFGSSDPHRPYDAGSGQAAGYDAAKVVVPAYWPDLPAVRADVLDYHAEVARFDQQIGRCLAALAGAGRLDDTLVIVTSDNGMPFPRCKANLHDSGTRMPLAIRFPARIPAGTRVDALVSLADLAPTILEATGVSVPALMSGRSLWPVIAGTQRRAAVFLERERHANVRAGDLGYPVRGIRTERWLYLRNVKPERWPAGDPTRWKSVGDYGDIDDGPTKQLIMTGPERFPRPFALGFAKRPAEELYDCDADPHQINNLAGRPEHAAVQADLTAQLAAWMQATGDPRATGDDERWDRFPYHGK